MTSSLGSSLGARGGVWIGETDCSLDDFRAAVDRTTDASDYPHATAIRGNVPVYASTSLIALAGTDRRAVQTELIAALADGPGVVVFENAFDPAVVDRASAAFTALIEAQRATGAAAGDHFGAAGANDRVWNAAQKLALHSPRVYAEYYANDIL